MSDKAQPIAVGDHVRLKAQASNAYQNAERLLAAGVPTLEPADGLVLSIRDITTGKLIKSAKGDLSRYVLEVVYDHTFNVKFSSLRNAPRGSDAPTATAAWKRLRAALREAAEAGTFYTTSSSNLRESPLGTLLDGWKVLKVWSGEVESQERPEPEPKAPVE